MSSIPLLPPGSGHRYLSSLLSLTLVSWLHLSDFFFHITANRLFWKCSQVPDGLFLPIEWSSQSLEWQTRPFVTWPLPISPTSSFTNYIPYYTHQGIFNFFLKAPCFWAFAYPIPSTWNALPFLLLPHSLILRIHKHHLLYHSPDFSVWVLRSHSTCVYLSKHLQWWALMAYLFVCLPHKSLRSLKGGTMACSSLYPQNAAQGPTENRSSANIWQLSSWWPRAWESSTHRLGTMEPLKLISAINQVFIPIWHTVGLHPWPACGWVGTMGSLWSMSYVWNYQVSCLSWKI